MTTSSSGDLTALFAPPTSQELSLVRADWAARPLVVEGYRLEASGLDGRGDTVHVISHLVDGERHFGALRFPRNFAPGGSYPLIVACHGGLSGVDLDEIGNVLSTFPGQCVDSEAFLLIPSFRGEDLITPFAGTFTSGGVPSWADRDVDDSSALLSAALANYPEIDEARIGAYGLSRGASVGLIMGARDARIRRVVSLFGFTDLSLPSVRTRIDAIQNHGVVPAGIGRVAWESFVQPWLSGALSLEEARLAWIRRSAAYFAADIPGVQAHHGLADTQVDSSHTAVLMDAITLAGGTTPDFQAFFYPDGLHGFSTLPGNGDRAEAYLCELQLGPRGYCGPMTPNANGGYAAASFEGSCSLSANDFVFRATGCPPRQFGLVFVSPTTAYTPSGAGFMCLGPGLQRLGFSLVDEGGTFSLPVDFTNQNALIAPYFSVGHDVHLQVVYRDPLNTLGPFNQSNGLTVPLTP
ncbi:MAG: hypothetical protein VX460_13150 [Planctomycetota bacterium]|nr:hypothetical protein [Planctomycetota bacterium]